MKSEMGRREFLSAPLKRMQAAFNDLRSKGDPENRQVEERDKYIERIGETISALAILYVAYKGSQDRVVTYSVEPKKMLKNTPEFQREIGSVSGLSKIFETIDLGTARLSDAWEGAFKDVTCTPESDGGMDCDTSWYEPSQITSKGVDRYTIENWGTFLTGFKGKIGGLQTEAMTAFDLSQSRDSLVLKEKEADKTSQEVAAALAYGIIGSLFVFYEEAARGISDVSYGDTIINDFKFIKRRTFLKLLATGVLAFKIRDIQKFFAENNKMNLLNEVEAHTNDVLAGLDAGSTDNFQRFFGISPLELRERLSDIESKCSLVLVEAPRSVFVRDSVDTRKPFEALQRKAQESIESFDKYFSFNKETGEYKIPKELTDVTRYLWATKEVVNYAQSRSSEINMRHFNDAGTMFLGLAGAALLGEFVIFPGIDKALKTKE